MAKPAIFAVIFGALLFALGMMPGVIARFLEGVRTTFLEEMRNLRQDFSPTPINTDLRIRGDIWLVVGGGVMMIAGLLALLLS